ncbi:MAG: fibrillarin-like rRNA/tRNA 2'-O-methyltransferase [Candidatus Thermoplasmatota archaeon]|nr:fibrillarin-like rRNA/tRNA 2'-O-methyltransferase [Candidatus Thermoplasmatota archaeon]
MNEKRVVSDGVYKIEDDYYTLNLVPGESVYGEKLLQIDDFEYRRWDPNRSKLGAFLIKEKGLPFRHDSEILYLGAGDGTTISHLSDILTEGKIYAVEVAKNPYRNLLDLSKERKNIFPILADAGDPDLYKDMVGKVDIVYQDIAQRNQVGIFLKNLQFLKGERYGLLAVKCRSIDVAKSPEKTVEEAEEKLKDEGHKIHSKTGISRWQKDHTILLIS